jgi:GTPase SAR1 family protein
MYYTGTDSSAVAARKGNDKRNATPFSAPTITMAAPASGSQAVPTFKLVLVGDGGTGKVGLS